jgi:hypothetical protein
MADEDVRQRLLGYLDEHAFDPVLHARPEEHPQNEQGKLTEIQQMVRDERARFQNCRSAADVYRQFEDEVRSDVHRETVREFRELHLPTLDDIRLDFQQMAGELGLRGESTFSTQ